MSPGFAKTVNTSHLEFAYHMRGGGIGRLELQYWREGWWTTRWSRQGSQGSKWLQAKVTLPSGVEMLRFVSSGPRTRDADVALDSVVAWQLQGPVPEQFLSLCSGGYHNCAIHRGTGQLKCWGSGLNGRLGSGREENVGNAPNQMGSALPAVELPEPARVVQVACGCWVEFNKSYHSSPYPRDWL